MMRARGKSYIGGGKQPGSFKQEMQTENTDFDFKIVECNTGAAAMLQRSSLCRLKLPH